MVAVLEKLLPSEVVMTAFVPSYPAEQPDVHAEPE